VSRGKSDWPHLKRVLGIREACRYVGFTPADRANLKRIFKKVESELPEMADHFYTWLMNNETASKILKEGPQQVDRLKTTLQIWARGLFCDSRDRRYGESRRRIGKKHVELNLPHLYVQGAFSVIRSFFFHKIHLIGGDPERRFRVIKSLNRALDLDLMLITESYSMTRENILAEGRDTERDVRNKVQQLLLRGRHHIIEIDAIKAELSRFIDVQSLTIMIHRRNLHSVEIYGSTSAEREVGLAPGLHVPYRDFVFKRTMESGEDMIVRAGSPKDGPLIKLWSRAGVARINALPLWIDHHIIGIVCFGSANRSPLPTEELEFLRSCAEMLAMAVSQAEAHDRVRDSEFQYRGLIESVSDLVYTVDSKNRIMLANPRALQLFEATLDQAVGQPISEFLPTDLERVLAHQHATVFKNKSPASAETVVSNAGERVVLSWRFMPITDTKGSCFSVTAVARDVTKERQETAHLLHRHKMAALGLMATGIAHEVANPLAAICSMAEELMETTTSPDSRQWLERITAQTQRAARTLRQMLDYARPAQDPTEGTSVEKVLRSTTEIAGFDSRSRKIQTSIDLPGSLPPVAISADRLSQVFLNLLLNAFDAMGTAGGEIEVFCKEREDQIEIVVHDNGPGIAKDVGERIFDPFTSTKAAGKGTGLGLYMCRQILQEAGGSLSHESHEGPGARMRIRVPRFDPMKVPH